MAKLRWNSVGTKFFESGLDRGVLYPKNGEGVAWNGLVEVIESEAGGEVNPYYQDGIKYYDESTPSEFSGSIRAYTYPSEFNEALGIKTHGRGLLLGNQSRSTFSFSYRTWVGSEAAGENSHYKIHVVYNATLSVDDVDRHTRSSTPSSVIFSWPFTTTPIMAKGLGYGSHFTICSNQTHPELLVYLEGALYGTDLEDPHLPPYQKIVDLYRGYSSKGYGYEGYGHMPYGHESDYIYG